MSGELVTIFGGSGFIGKTLVQHLAKAGYRIRVAVRRPNNALFLKPLGELGQIQISQANIRNRLSIEAAVKGADYVINLVGILYESGSQTFDGIHNKGAELIAEIAAIGGVKHLIHLSAIGADEESISKYARSKAAGEAAVLKNFPTATILRSSVVFGPDDKFFNKFAGLAKMFQILPVICGDSKMQPVYVGDLALAMEKVIGNRDAYGKIYEIGGPEVYTMHELMKMVNEITEQDVPLINVPLKLAYFKAFFLGMWPNPMVTMDQLRMLEKDNVVSGELPTLEDLGITPTPVEAVIPKYLIQYRPTGQFKATG